MLQTLKLMILLFSQSVILVCSITTPQVTQGSSKKLPQRWNNLHPPYLVTIFNRKKSHKSYREIIIETYKRYYKVPRKFKMQTPQILQIDKVSSLLTKDVIWTSFAKTHRNHKNHLRNRRVINERLYSMLLKSLNHHRNPIISIPILFKQNNKK